MWRLLLMATLLLAGCDQQLPKPECDPASQHPDSLLHCDTAVGKALGVLPSDHQTITRVQFLYGSARPYDCGRGPLKAQPSIGLCLRRVHLLQ
jgi:hypothetical protein